MRLLIGTNDGLRSRENWLDLVATLANAADDFALRCDGFSGCELTTRYMQPFHSLEFSGCDSGIKIAPNLGVGDLTHAPPESISDQRPLIDNSFSLEVFI